MATYQEKLDEFYKKLGPKYKGMPPAPGYQNTYDPATMDITSELEQRLASIMLNKQGLEAMRAEALRPGQSLWAALQNKQQGMIENQNRDRLRADVGGQSATAMSRLAMSGGLTSGARERVARAGMQAGIQGSQQAAYEGARNRMGVGIQDQANKLAMLQALPGAELGVYNADMAKQQAWADSRTADINRRIADSQALNQYNQNIYNKAAEAWGTKQTADATRDARFFCTEMRRRKLLSREEFSKMSQKFFRAFLSRANFGVWYFNFGPKLVVLANAKGLDWAEWKSKLVDEVLATKDRVEAESKYIQHTLDLAELILQRSFENERREFTKPNLLASLKAIPALLKHESLKIWLTKRVKRSLKAFVFKNLLGGRVCLGGY